MKVSRNERRTSQLQALNEMPLYPTEDIIWNENIVPTEYFSGEGCLALPKLNLQFLTLHDYLLRNFNLFRLESTCKIYYGAAFTLAKTKNKLIFQMRSDKTLRMPFQDSAHGMYYLLIIFFEAPNTKNYYRQSEDGGVYFGGWARMAQPIIGFTVVEVARPNIGEKRPARVRADVSVHLNVRREIKNEWENLRKHDACFLVCVQPSNTIGS
jgi:intron-binding protein aquarius